MNPNARGPPEPQGELRPSTTLITYNQPAQEGHHAMITPEYSKRHNCPTCGHRSCLGCDEPPERDDPYGSPYGDEPEALGWTLASAEDLYPIPKRDGSAQDDPSR